MLNYLKTKLVNTYRWLKRKAKALLIAVGIIGVAMAAPQAIPSDFALEKVQQKYEQSQLKAEYKLENVAFIRQAIDENAIQIEVGDKNLSVFSPEMTIRRWDDEVHLKVKYKEPKQKGIKNPFAKNTLNLDGNKIKWKGNKTEVHYYNVPETEDHPEAYEVEVILLEKPDTNVVGFDIETDGLAFYYQPALNEEDNPEADYCTETHCYKDEMEIIHRPENVVGSYAVYHENKQGDYSKMDGKNYMAGKAFHIYRPKIIDSAGKEVWGKLNITGNLLTVTIPQEFLDNAVYPVRHAAGLTIGYTTVGETHQSAATQSSYGSLFTGAAGTATTISAYGFPGTNWWKFSLYLHSNLTNIEVTDASNEGSSDDWRTLTLLSETEISAVEYLLMVGGNSTFYLQRDSGDADQGHYDPDGYNAYQAEVLDNISHSTNKFSIYCTYTAGGGADRRIIITQ